MAEGDYNPYRVVNPAAGNVYFDTSGSALSDSSQPTVNTGRAINLGATNRDKLNYLALGSTETDIYGAQVMQTDSSGNGVSKQVPRTGGTFATMTAGRYVMRRGGANTEFLAGVANTTLRSGASDYGIRRSIKSRTIVRGPLTAQAIRQNRWSFISGVWINASGGRVPADSPIASTNGLGDTQGNVTGGVDDAVPSGAQPGELVYIGGGTSTILIPTQANYPNRTTW